MIGALSLKSLLRERAALSMACHQWHAWSVNKASEIVQSQVDGSKPADQEQVRAIAGQPFVSFIHAASKRKAAMADDK